MFRTTALIVGAGLLLGGCKVTVADPTPEGSVASSKPPAAPSSAPAGATRSADAGAGTGAVECRKAGGLSVKLGREDSGSTHRSIRLIFTNGGAKTCRMTGYPGVAALDAAGAQVAQAQRTTSGYLGGTGEVKTITLAPGGSAVAVVEGSAAAADGSSCAGFAGLLATAPDDTASTSLQWRTDTCAGLQVHPVRPGDS